MEIIGEIAVLIRSNLWHKAANITPVIMPNTSPEMTLKNAIKITLNASPETLIFSSAAAVSDTPGMKYPLPIIRANTSHIASILIADKIIFKHLYKGRMRLSFIVEFVIWELSTYEIR